MVLLGTYVRINFFARPGGDLRAPRGGGRPPHVTCVFGQGEGEVCSHSSTLPTAWQPKGLGGHALISCCFNSYFQVVVGGKEFLQACPLEVGLLDLANKNREGPTKFECQINSR